jgi:hypothetical protein
VVEHWDFVSGAEYGTTDVAIAPRRISSFAFQRLLDDHRAAIRVSRSSSATALWPISSRSFSRVRFVRIFFASGAPFTQAGRQTGPRWFRLSGENAFQSSFGQA